MDYALGLYEKAMPHTMSLREKLGFARDSGFDFLEVSVDETEEKLSRLWWDKNKLREVTGAVYDEGIPIGSMCLSALRKYPYGHPDENIRRKSLEITERAIGLACRWGIRIIQIPGYDVYYEESGEKTRELFLESLRAAVPLAAKSGVVLAFETMETPFMDTVEKAVSYVKTIDSPYLQLYPDMGNITSSSVLYGHDVKADMETGRGHFAALHLKETAPGIYREMTYGTGHVDFALGISTALELGVRRFVGEFWDAGDYAAQIAEAHRFLRGLFINAEAVECT